MPFHPSTSHWTRAAFAAVALLSLIGLVTGCGQNPVQGKPARPAGNGVAGDPAKVDGAIQPDAPGQQAEQPAAKTPLIRGIAEVLENNPALEDDTKAPLREQLQQADEILSAAKSQSRNALKEVNRQQRTRRSTSPNIVMVIVNDLAVSDLACYGATGVQTPNIDRLAAAGTRFTQFYAGSPNKADAHWCLAAGGRPVDAPAWSKSSPVLLPENITVAETMWQAGYTTGLFGDWGVLGPQGPASPQDQGYDEWLGAFETIDEPTAYPTSVTHNGRTIKFTKNENGQRGQRAQAFYVTEAAEFLVRSYRKRPIFLQVYLTIDGSSAAPADLAKYADQAWSDAAKSRAAAMTRIDREIGLLMARLTDIKQLGNTIFVITSDTPDQAASKALLADAKSPTKLRGGPGDLYEGSLRVPLIISGTSRVPANRDCAAVSAAWDLAPTIYQLVSAQKQPVRKAGQSLVPYLPANAKLPTRFLYWELKHGAPDIAARFKNWKVVRRAGGNQFELYDLDTDAAESKNVVEQHPDVMAEIQSRLTPKNEQARR